MAHHTGTHAASEMEQCIDECTACHAICLRTVGHCLELGGKHADSAHMRLLLDCAEICQMSVNFMLRGSDLPQRTCAVCAEVCRACAEDCERMAGGDEMMLDCAEQCRQCAESCERVAA